MNDETPPNPLDPAGNPNPEQEFDPDRTVPLGSGLAGVPLPPSPQARRPEPPPRDLLQGGLSKPPEMWMPPSAEELSRFLPEYEIVAILGRGGMGAVYKAIQKSLDRPVAIKLLPPELGADLEFEARFQREAKAMARLNHPNIIQIYDFGRTSGGHCYFVMEFVDGADLHHLIRRGKVTPDTALKLVIQVCEALQYAHDKGYVHRDIKPANILLTSEGVAKVGDFGLAKLIDPTQGTETDQLGLTMTGISMGTPNYMAPEQLTGSEAIDHRADIYSLGVMFYEMLTGEIPRGAFVPPSGKIPVDARVDDVVLKAMHEHPAERYQSARAVETDVHTIRTDPRGQTLASRERTSKAIQRKKAKAKPKKADPLGAIALVLVVLSLAGGGGAWWWLNRPKAVGSPVESGTTTPSVIATKEKPFENSFGMKFVPVPITGGPTGGKNVLFSIWETRVKDYEAFVKVTKREWPKADFAQTVDHPAVNLSWEDAVAFCGWLTIEDRKSGKIGPNDVYRLPSDHEWSCAVGIGKDENPAASPSDKNGKIAGYPWGKDFHPPKGAGNLLGEETKRNPLTDKTPISGYDDGFERTAPVGSFVANEVGLYNLVGNVREWCDDLFEPGSPEKRRVLRGGSWRSDGAEFGLRSSCRDREAPTFRTVNVGFRVVLEVGRSGAATTDAAKATKDVPFENNLLMRFVPVPITGGPTGGKTVLFSIWETRVKDYEAFVKAQPREWPKADFPQTGEHPATMVSWEEAVAFCAWLTEQDRKHGRIGSKDVYRLPTDHEWSCAVGIGKGEDAAATAVTKNNKIGEYSWGPQWPPPRGTGNFLGEETKANPPAILGDLPPQPVITGYDDRFDRTAPVGSFPANGFGLHDLVGNGTEWCQDWFDPAKAEQRVKRGGGWTNGGELYLRSSHRDYGTPRSRFRADAFRCVLEIGSLTQQPVIANPAPKPFPPGQWVKVITKLEDVPESARKENGTTWENGWVVAPKNFGWRLGETKGASPMKNGGIRITASPGADFNLRLRDAKSGKGDYYAWFSGDSLGRGRFEGDKDNRTYFLKAAQPKDQTGDVVWEFAVVGHRLIARASGQLVGTVVNDEITEGFPGIVNGVGRFRDLEIINLDGLSEREALRMLGVDEKGNDLRALPANATKETPFGNSLGMRFVPVPITGGPTGGKRVLFSVWETRVKDYEAFVKVTKFAWPKPDFPQTGEHPATNVSWEDAVAFCKWLTAEDRKSGKIGPKEVYRLPTDHEWSCAVGIGKDEDPAASPAVKDRKIEVFPWGKDFPPPKGAGNFYGEETKRNPVPNRTVMSGYDDGFERTAPVGISAANTLGLYDLGGNVTEWCDEWMDPAKPIDRVKRGGSGFSDGGSRLFSSNRFNGGPSTRYNDGGFRVILEVTAIPPKIDLPPALAAMKARGGRLRAWGTDDRSDGARPLDISAAEGLTDLVRIEADPVETSSGVWVAWRKDGTISRPATFSFYKNTRYREFNRQLRLDESGRFSGEIPEGQLGADFAKLFASVPQGSVIDVARGWYFAALLTRDGRVVAGTGTPNQGSTFSPEIVGAINATERAVEIEGGTYSLVVLLEDGTVRSFMNDSILTPPAEAKDIVGIAAGQDFVIALTRTGKVIAWGPNTKEGQLNVPSLPGRAVKVKAFSRIGAAQMEDGRWIAWGDNKGGVVDRINALGPVPDIGFMKTGVFWIEPADAQPVPAGNATKEKPFENY